MYYTKTTGYSSLLTYGRDLASTSVYGIPQFADPQLASCIPAAESQFKQFVRFIHPFYEQSAWWPNDNATAPGGGGGYIGLMQVKTSMLTAFNWNSNVEHGTLTLSDKIRVAFKYVGKRLLENPRLPRPDVEQIEDISLGYYSGLGSTAGHQYWVPNAKRPNATEWIVAAQDKLKEYVLKVRSCK